MNRTMIEQLSLAPILEGILAEITQHQIDRDGSKFDEPKKGEKKIGEVTDDFARRLNCASKVLMAKATESKLKSSTAPDDNAEKSLLDDANQTKMLAEIVRDLFWYEVKSLTGCWDGNIGVRKNWVIVETAETEIPEVLKRLFGGNIE